MRSIITVLILLISISGAVSGQGLSYTSEAELKDQVAAAPCGKNEDRMAAVKDLFIKAGAAPDDVKIDKIKDVENVVVTKRGKSAETIIIGAHYDKTKDGCGAMDNWTGIVIIANIYRTLRPLATNKTYMFVGFGREEEGLIGSTAMAERIKKEDRASYCAMVNFDSFGLSFPQAMRHISTPSLIELAESVSKEMKIPFAQAAEEGASSDSAPFRNVKIPAITLHGLSGRWSDYLHSSSDKASNVKMPSVNVGYRHGIFLLAKMEAAACDAYRK